MFVYWESYLLKYKFQRYLLKRTDNLSLRSCLIFGLFWSSTLNNWDAYKKTHKKMITYFCLSHYIDLNNTSAKQECFGRKSNISVECYFALPQTQLSAPSRGQKDKNFFHNVGKWERDAWTYEMTIKSCYYNYLI